MARSVSRQFALPPSGLLRFRIEFNGLVPVDRLQHADPGEHRRAVRFRDQDQGLNGGLPCRMVLLGLRQLRDVVRRILERQKRLSLRDRNRIIEVGGSGH
ncbi:hypothetical protein [Bradyrhizobium sp.]|uniref:hypothetical protein n=1 Tax=Bradyrhizobium sp. TaxID=376 RepID=UPI003BAE84E2